MSRAATVAYRLPELDHARPQHWVDSASIRLLGATDGSTGNTSSRSILRSLPVRETASYARVDEPPYLGYHAAEAEPKRYRRRITVPLRGTGTVVVLLATACLLFRALAPISARSGPLVLSGYSDIKLSSGQTGVINGPAKAPAVIDGTTAPAQAAKPEPSQSGAYTLLGPPSLSVPQIEAVLRQYNSPAIGQGQKLYELGIKYGINPAYALAFFVHESGCGTKGVARFSKSIGNIRWTEGYGNYEGYRSYPDWESGINDWYKLITDLYINGWNLRTVDAIIPVYAPWGDNNNPPGYIASVKSLVDSWRGK